MRDVKNLQSIIDDKANRKFEDDASAVKQALKNLFIDGVDKETLALKHGDEDVRLSDLSIIIIAAAKETQMTRYRNNAAREFVTKVERLDKELEELLENTNEN